MNPGSSAALPQADAASPVTEIGPYRVVRKLGQGGSGSVYLAVDPRIARTVAIKLLPPDEPEFHARLINEARAVNIVHHRGIVGVSDVGHLENGSAYLVMDYLDGQTLRAELASRPSLPSLLRFARQIAVALSATHASAIIHRDLKPENVMIVSDDAVPGGKRAIVFDFGIAKLAAEQKHPSTQQDQTDSRMAIGTATYMAPEQATGMGAITDRVDVYALGVMLYELVSGAPPFSAKSYALLLDMHRYSAPVPLAKLAPEAPAALAALIHQMLGKDPSLRPTMAQVVAGLDAILGEAHQAQPTTPSAAESPATATAPLPRENTDRRKLRAGHADAQPAPRPRRVRNTEPLPQRRDSTTLPLARLLASEETLPPLSAAVTPQAAREAVVCGLGSASLQDSETVPIARTDFAVAPVEDSQGVKDDAETDTKPPLRRTRQTQGLQISVSVPALALGAVLIFLWGFLLRACLQ